ncbi:MAG: menaquinone biosynthesis protein [Bacteroidales bacterium]|jgi:chorismate dehydratase|nr:menaquinone biosynthesis protein [Bacteroidales bacterium]MCU0408038.1 menaquinone biosynthesis protein [Bacteroidales bacterium]
MGKIRVSAVRYANTYPFIYGLTASGFTDNIELSTDHPAACAEKLINGTADLGLVPVAALPDLREHFIVGDYCIGADGEVRTVMLLSNTDFDEIRSIYLDYRSRSSVALTRVLAKNFWKREFNWINTEEGFRFEDLAPGEAAVLIGDQCFEIENRFSRKKDLALEWKNYTGLPFVFACWVSNIRLGEDFIASFNQALRSGVENIDAVVEAYRQSGSISGPVLRRYLTVNIDFKLDSLKRSAMEKFLGLIRQQDLK